MADLCNVLQRNSQIKLTYSNETEKGITHRQSALKIVSAYDQEIPQSQTADNPKAPRGRAT